jgi:hypothetical protein
MDGLVLSNARAEHYFLRSNWTEFTLLNMTVHCPVRSAELEVTLVSGTKSYRSTAHTQIPLHRGWNTLRLDLAEAASHVALDDIREIRWSLPTVDEATELVIDDILLVDNRRSLFGDPGNTTGEMYVDRRGRRWQIGAGGRFQLGFSHGQIVSWRDLASPSDRGVNLLGSSVLGPTPIVMPEYGESGDKDGTDFAELGAVVVARQWIEEASQLRVILAGEWRFVEPGATPDDSSPFQRWTYTIYRTGQIYVHVECTAETAAWQAGELGLAVSRHDDPTLDIRTHSAGQLGAAERLRHVSYAFARSADVPDLLFAAYDAKQAPQFEAIRDSQEHRLHLIASGGMTRRPMHTWDCMLTVWPNDSCHDNGAVQRVLDYCEKVNIRLTKGSWVTDRPGDVNGDGFDEQFGCYAIAPEASSVKLTFDGREQPNFYPAFVVSGTAEQEWSVYYNFAVLESVSRDASGNLLVQIPEVIHSEAVLEISSVPRATSKVP